VAWSCDGGKNSYRVDMLKSEEEEEEVELKNILYYGQNTVLLKFLWYKNPVNLSFLYFK
jgi:hypothetical protein